MKTRKLISIILVSVMLFGIFSIAPVSARSADNPLNLAFRQQSAVDRAKALFEKVGEGDIAKFPAAFRALFEAILSVLIDAPLTPLGDKLDLSGYELVFEDDFDGESIDLDSWYIRGEGKSRGGYKSGDQIKVKDGNLIMSGQYDENGKFGSGWYGGDLALIEKYKEGYFECRCICNTGTGFWSAFWIQARHPYEAEYSQGGVGGAELDIFESIYENRRNSFIFQTIHCAGVDGVQEGFQSRILGFYRGKNINKEYNTYGLKWTDEEYIFYVNGVETTRSTFGNGVSTVEEEVILSICIPDAEILDKLDKDKYYTEYIVDYVRIYQESENG